MCRWCPVRCSLPCAPRCGARTVAAADGAGCCLTQRRSASQASFANSQAMRKPLEGALSVVEAAMHAVASGQGEA
jgi:hypothetical protein